MANRQIKDAKDLSTNELIYFKGHAKATYMSDGTTVEDAINNIDTSGGESDENVVKGWINEYGSVYGIILPDGRELSIGNGSSLATNANIMYKIEAALIGSLSEIENCFNGDIPSTSIELAYLAVPDFLCYVGDEEGSICGYVTGQKADWGNGTITITILTYNCKLITITAVMDSPEIYPNQINIIDLKNGTGGSSSGGGNVQAIVRDGYYEPEDRPVRDAKDLTTNELVYFRGNSKYICTSNGAMLEDELDDIRNSASIFKIDMVEEDYSESPEYEYPDTPGELLNAITREGVVLLNGGIAVGGETASGELIINSAVVYNNNLTVTTVYLSDDVARYYKVTIDEYPISGGGSGSSGSNITSIKINNVSKTPSNGVVDLGYINKQLSTSTSSSMTLSPNIYYRNTSTSLSSLTITLGSVSNSNIINEYFVEFTTRSSGTTVSLPSTIKWVNGTAPTFEAGATYQISIVNNLGTCLKFA